MQTKKASLKSKSEIEAMKAGGKILGRIKAGAMKRIKEGVGAGEIEDYVTSEIEKAGGKPSFKMVPGYKWSTCVNVNEGLVHGIPHESIVFKEGDIVSVDMGMYYMGMHTDTSDSVLVGESPKKAEFLKAGKKALKAAISQAQEGKKIRDISEAMQKTLEEAGMSPVRALVGHGIGSNLHEYPPVPCVVTKGVEMDFPLKKGHALAIEVMYGEKGPVDIKIEDDRWTVSLKSGKISGLFEETVVIGTPKPQIITATR